MFLIHSHWMRTYILIAVLETVIGVADLTEENIKM